MAKGSDRPPLPPEAPSFRVEYVRSPRRSRRRKPIHVVAAIAASVFLIFTSAMAFSFRLPVLVNWASSAESKTAPPIELSALGKTPSQLGKLHRDLSLGMGPMGEKTAKFTTPAGLHTVWFVDRNGTETAFLVRLDRRLPFSSHDEVHSYLSGLFGSPATVDCQRGYVGFRDSCRFRWWLSGNVTLRADSAFPARAASPDVDLALIAQDTRLSGGASRPKAY